LIGIALEYDNFCLVFAIIANVILFVIVLAQVLRYREALIFTILYFIISFVGNLIITIIRLSIMNEFGISLYSIILGSSLFEILIMIVLSIIGLCNCNRLNKENNPENE
jgi:hypothetical protein